MQFNFEEYIFFLFEEVKQKYFLHNKHHIVVDTGIFSLFNIKNLFHLNFFRVENLKNIFLTTIANIFYSNINTRNKMHTYPLCVINKIIYCGIGYLCLVLTLFVVHNVFWVKAKFKNLENT